MRRETAIYISGYILTIAIAITLIIYFIKGRECFTTEIYQEINQPALDRKTVDRLKLQNLINKYETNYTCCNGYSEPSNTCAFSFNTDFYPGSYK